MGETNGPWKWVMFVGLIGIDLSLTTLGGFWLGRMIDRWLNSDPAFLVAGVLIGLAVGIYSIIKMVKPFIGEE